MVQEKAQMKKRGRKPKAASSEGTKAKVGRPKKKMQSASQSSKLLRSFPESIENLEVIQKVANMLEELRDRANDVKEEASKEVDKLIKRYEGTYKDIEKRVSAVSKEARKQAQISMMQLMQKWHETKEKWPSSFSLETEKILNSIGMKKELLKKVNAMRKTKAKKGPSSMGHGKVQRKTSSGVGRRKRKTKIEEAGS